MPRRSKGKNVRKRKHVRLTFRELCDIAEIKPKQRIIMMRYIKQKLKGGESI